MGGEAEADGGGVEFGLVAQPADGGLVAGEEPPAEGGERDAVPRDREGGTASVAGSSQHRGAGGGGSGGAPRQSRLFSQRMWSRLSSDCQRTVVGAITKRGGVSAAGGSTRSPATAAAAGGRRDADDGQRRDEERGLAAIGDAGLAFDGDDAADRHRAAVGQVERQHELQWW